MPSSSQAGRFWGPRPPTGAKGVESVFWGEEPPLPPGFDGWRDLTLGGPGLFNLCREPEAQTHLL